MGARLIGNHFQLSALKQRQQRTHRREENDATPHSKPDRTWPAPQPDGLRRSSGADRRPASAIGCPHSIDLPQDASQASVPTLHVTSREIVVDVMVTDAKGNAVHGLKQTDFSIEENGKPQPIRSFREFGTEPGRGTCTAEAAALDLYQQPVDAGQRAGRHPADRRTA
jgi:hypothetical protein